MRLSLKRTFNYTRTCMKQRMLFLKQMIIASNIYEIKSKFDFTDSIIIDVKWIKNLTDLSIKIDYYWDLQDGKIEPRELTLNFKDCLKADFSIKRDLFQLSKEEVNYDSWFTILLFESVANNQNMKEGTHQINIYTFDYSNPWVKILCRDVTLEQ